MKADDVKTALQARWPVTEYVHVHEAPLDSARMGTKIDVLVLSCWASRRWEIDAVEVKVSVADFRNEIRRAEYQYRLLDDIEDMVRQSPIKPIRYGYERPGTGLDVDSVRRVFVSDTSKSLPWRERAHRFWIACPETIAGKIERELPDGWGLIAVDDAGRTRQVCPPKKNRNPAPIEWSAVVGIIRAAQDLGLALRDRMWTKALDQAAVSVGEELVALREEVRLLRDEQQEAWTGARKHAEAFVNADVESYRRQIRDMRAELVQLRRGGSA